MATIDKNGAYPFYHNEVDALLKARIDEEIRRAKEAEEAIRGEAEGAVSSEAEERKAADEALSAAIEAEASRAKEAEASISSALEAESSRAKEAEEALSSSISAESSAREEGDARAMAAVEAEAEAREEGDQALSSSLSVESERAKGAEAALDEKKVDKIAPESGTAVYAATPEGQTSLKASESPEGGALPVYGANGTLSVSEPASEGDAATKGYVDSGLAGKVDSSVPYLIYEEMANS